MKKWEVALAKALRMARSLEGVVGVDYGFVYKNGERLKTRGIRFHVPTKLPLEELPAKDVTPKKLDNIRCDVVEASYVLHGNPKAECNPMRPGISVGNLTRNKTGTLGMFVTDTVNNRRALLSNWHVLCGSPAAAAGDDVCQPGPHHAGTMTARVAGKLERWANLDTGCDAAIALLVDGVAVDQTVFDQLNAIQGIEAPTVGMKVIKYGAVSHLTHGMVDGVGGSYEMDYSNYGDTKRWIDGIRIVVDPDSPEAEISLAGDSGSAWINPKTNKAVALHFAGEDGLGPTAEYALAQPLVRVFSILGIAGMS
jgi:hypothetical protein